MEYLKFDVIKNGIFVPEGFVSKQDIVYDDNFEIVLDSCVLRGNNKSENVTNPPQHLPYEITKDIESIDGRLLFMGQFIREHYGHFLTEGVSRYWYLLDNPVKGWKIPTSKNPFGIKKRLKNIVNPSSSYWKKAMLTFNINSNDILCVKKPIRADEIIVPQCSMYNRYKIYQKHLDVTRRLAKNIIGTTKIKKDKTPVYLSRTKLNKSMRSYLGEEPIEEFCENMGCKIVYSERLSLKEQVILFNKHDVFIGCVGSAFHSILFRFVEMSAINIYLTTESTNSNYEMIDSLMQNESHYISCIIPASDKIKTHLLDSQKAISELDDILRDLKQTR